MKLSAERRTQPPKSIEALYQADEGEEVVPNDFYREKVPAWMKQWVEGPISLAPDEGIPMVRILLRSMVKKTVLPVDALKGKVKGVKEKYDRFVIQDTLEDNLADRRTEFLAELKQAQLMLGETNGIDSQQLDKLRIVLRPKNLIQAQELSHDDRLLLMFEGAQLLPEFQPEYRAYLQSHLDEILTYYKNKWLSDSDLDEAFWSLTKLALLLPEAKMQIKDLLADEQTQWEVDSDIPQSLLNVWGGLYCFMILNQEEIGIDADGRIFVMPKIVHPNLPARGLPVRATI